MNVRNRLIWLVCAVMFRCAGAVATPALAAEKPNFLIIYADDLGWGELGCQGNKEIPTPHIDSIAANGIRFTQGYVAATYCSPSRGIDERTLPHAVRARVQ